ncbi:MAG: hypothetical protein JNK67_15000 [Alphaproteobacteria bacterium]|nr:hypothetical protein [Alphaproteobacteria bacterium]
MFRLGAALAVFFLAACLAQPAPAGSRANGKASALPLRAKALEQRARREDAPARADTLRRSAQLWLSGGQREKALAALSAAIETRPTDATLWLRRAELRAAMGDLWDAVDDATQAIDVDPARVSAFTLRASLWRRLEVADMAAADLERALELRPDAEPLRAMLAALTQPAAGPPARHFDSLDLQAAPPRAPAAGPAKAAPAIAALDPLVTATAPLAAPRTLVPAAIATPRPAGAASALDAATLAAARPGTPRSLIPDRPAKSIDATALDSDLMAASRAQARATLPAPMPIPAGPPRGLAPAVVALPPGPHRSAGATDAATVATIAPAAGPAVAAAATAAAHAARSEAVPPAEPAPRWTNAPPPRIYRGAEIPSALGQRSGLPRVETATGGVGGPFMPARPRGRSAAHADDASRPTGGRATNVPPMARPILPPRKRAARTTLPASFDATPADPMREDLVAAPRMRVDQERLR